MSFLTYKATQIKSKRILITHLYYNAKKIFHIDIKNFTLTTRMLVRLFKKNNGIDDHANITIYTTNDLQDHNWNKHTSKSLKLIL